MLAYLTNLKDHCDTCQLHYNQACIALLKRHPHVITAAGELIGSSLGSYCRGDAEATDFVWARFMRLLDWPDGLAADVLTVGWPSPLVRACFVVCVVAARRAALHHLRSGLTPGKYYAYAKLGQPWKPDVEQALLVAVLEVLVNAAGRSDVASALLVTTPTQLVPRWAADPLYDTTPPVVAALAAVFDHASQPEVIERACELFAHLLLGPRSDKAEEAMSSCCLASTGASLLDLPPELVDGHCMHAKVQAEERDWDGHEYGSPLAGVPMALWALARMHIHTYGGCLWKCMAWVP